MTVQDLEQVIHEYIQDIYHEEYIGKLYIEKLDPVGYYIKFGLATPEKPWVLYAELPDEQFLKFLKEELKGKRWNLMHFGELKLTYPAGCDPIDNKCGCNDKTRTN